MTLHTLHSTNLAKLIRAVELVVSVMCTHIVFLNRQVHNNKVSPCNHFFHHKFFPQSRCKGQQVGQAIIAAEGKYFVIKKGEKTERYTAVPTTTTTTTTATATGAQTSSSQQVASNLIERRRRRRRRRRRGNLLHKHTHCCSTFCTFDRLSRS